MTYGCRSEDHVTIHTPGQWIVVGLCVDSATHGNICLSSLARTPAEQQANLRLIAAAPALLKLAEQFASECAECMGNGYKIALTDTGMPLGRVDCEACADIRATIAAARGAE